MSTSAYTHVHVFARACPEIKLKRRDSHMFSIGFVLDLSQEAGGDFPLFVTLETPTGCDYSRI